MVTNHAVASRAYDERVVQTKSELNEAMGIDAAVSARGTWGSASGAASYFKDVKMTSSAFYWLVNANFKLSDENLDMGDVAFTLTDEAKSMLEKPDGLDSFRRACGDFFYSGVRLGARYALLYEFRTEETSVIERLQAKAKYSGFGVEAAAEFQKLLATAAKASALTIHAASEGGGEDLRVHANDPSDLRDQLQQLQHDLYADHKGVAMEFLMSDYDMFPEVQRARAVAAAHAADIPSAVLLQASDAAMRRLFHRHSVNVDVEGQVEALLERAAGREPLCALSRQHVETLHALQQAIAASNGEIAAYARQCLSDPAACEIPATTLQSPWEPGGLDAVLTPDADFTTLRGWTLEVEPQRPGSMFVHLVASPPEDRSQKFVFDTDHSLMAIGPDAEASPQL